MFFLKWAKRLVKQSPPCGQLAQQDFASWVTSESAREALLQSATLPEMVIGGYDPCTFKLTGSLSLHIALSEVSSSFSRQTFWRWRLLLGCRWGLAHPVSWEGEKEMKVAHERICCMPDEPSRWPWIGWVKHVGASRQIPKTHKADPITWNDKKTITDNFPETEQPPQEPNPCNPAPWDELSRRPWISPQEVMAPEKGVVHEAYDWNTEQAAAAATCDVSHRTGTSWCTMYHARHQLITHYFSHVAARCTVL